MLFDNPVPYHLIQRNSLNDVQILKAGYFIHAA